MNSFLQPLFSTSIKKYTYEISFERVRSDLEAIFHKSGKLFGSIDIYARFTGGDTFEIETISMVMTNGVKYGSTLYGTVQKEGENKTVIVTETKPAVSFKILFWLLIIVSLFCIIKSIFYQQLELFWLGIVFGTIGPFLTIKLASINTAGVEERYRLFIDKKLKSLKVD